MVGRIENIHAREVLDDKGLPTVEVDVLLDDGSLGWVAAAAGTSRGINEAVDLRDGDESYFDGMGVSKAIANVNTEIADRLKGENAIDQNRIDNLLIKLDGTGDKSRLGGNAIIATSIANAKAAARSQGIALFEQLGGGCEMPLSHVLVMVGGPAYVGMPGIADFQEYVLVALNVDSCQEGYIKTLPIYKRLCAVVAQQQGLSLPRLPNVRGTLLAKFPSNEAVFATLTRLIEEVGYVPGRDFGIYVDMAASQLYREGCYHLNLDKEVLTREEWIHKLEELCARYPIISMEDCLYEDDWEGWVELTRCLGDRVQLVGDDFFVTNPQRLKKGIKMGAANAIVIKPNQVGTLTETIETIKIAKAAGYGTVVSGRSGELWDPYLMHLCVGQNLGRGKINRCPFLGQQNLNELKRIEDYLGGQVIYRGKGVLPQFH